MTIETGELENAARQIRNALDHLDGLEREFTRKNIIADFTRILTAPIASDEIKWQAFRSRIQKV